MSLSFFCASLSSLLIKSHSLDLGPTLNLGGFHLEIPNYIYKDPVSVHFEIPSGHEFIGGTRVGDQTIVS